LNDLSKYAKDESFKENVNKFFWDVITQTDPLKASSLIVTGMNFIRTNKIQIYKKPSYMSNDTYSNGNEP